MKRLFDWMPVHIAYILRTFLAGMAAFTLIRLFLFYIYFHQVYTIPLEAGRLDLMLRSFFMGSRFDIVISGYILSVPFLVLTITALLHLEYPKLYKTVTIYLGVLYILAFTICFLDIPYFGYYNSRFSAIVFDWIDDAGFLFKMVIQESTNWGYFLIYLPWCVIFWFTLKRFGRKSILAVENPARRSQPPSMTRAVTVSFVCLLLLFLGIRGRVAKKSPIRVGTAYFSNYSFPNQLALNPVFTFVRSFLNDFGTNKAPWSSKPKASDLKKARQYLNLEGESPFLSPIARQVQPGEKELRANVVLVIMESMASGKLGELTPNMNRLIDQSLFFNNIYTAGIHTYNGIYATLFSYPTVPREHPLKSVSMLSYAGLANTMRERGYNTVYFTTHDDQFDNVGGFLRANGFSEVISQEDYPSEKVLSTLGVADDYLFSFTVPHLNRLQRMGTPFLAVIMTGSDHPPYVIPGDIPFEPKGEGVQQKVVSYADWSLGQFIKLASRQSWFDNTVFVFVADHGTNLDPVYDMPLSYYRTPLLFYSPRLIPGARVVDKLGGQIDVFPTLMGLINVPYINNTLGVDLMKESRPFIFFNDDFRVGCIGEEYFLVLRRDGGDSLYAYRDGDTTNYIKEKTGITQAMKDYAYTMIRTARWMIRNRRVGKPSGK